jgi:hypothetical protein
MRADSSISNRAKAASAAAIVKKVQAGKAATRAELSLLQEVEAEQQATAAGDVIRDAVRILVGTKVIKLFFGVTDQTLSNWCRANMPKAAPGVYDLIACFAWWDKTMNSGGDTGSTAKSKERYWAAKADREEIDRDRSRGDLIERDAVGQAWAWRVAEVAAGLNALATRLPPMLEGKSQPDMRDLIGAEVRQLRESYARAGRHCEEEKPCQEKKPTRGRPRGSRDKRKRSNRSPSKR